jgi:hypothetical protein
MEATGSHQEKRAKKARKRCEHAAAAAHCRINEGACYNLKLIFSLTASLGWSFYGN